MFFSLRDQMHDVPFSFLPVGEHGHPPRQRETISPANLRVSDALLCSPESTPVSGGMCEVQRQTRPPATSAMRRVPAGGEWGDGSFVVFQKRKRTTGSSILEEHLESDIANKSD